MPRKFIRKTTRQSWSQEDMTQAIHAVLEGRMGYRKASKTHKVPLSTLERRLRNARANNQTPEEAAKKRMGRFDTVLTAEQESELVKYIIHFEERLFGLTFTNLRELAFQLAEKYQVTHPFDKDLRKAGKDWMYGFLDRHKEVSLIINSERTKSLADGEGFPGVMSETFYSVLEEIYDKNPFSPDDIYTVDEVGILSAPDKILALRAKKQPSEGVLVSVETCFNAAGNYMPPMFIFPRKDPDPTFLQGASEGSFAFFHETGSVNKESFSFWFEKFIDFSKPSPEKPVLLLLNGQASHTINIDFITRAREANVVVLCFQSRCTQSLQPMDVSFISNLSASYEQEVKQWLSANQARKVGIELVARLFSKAYERVAIKSAASNGFESTGLWPRNTSVS